MPLPKSILMLHDAEKNRLLEEACDTLAALVQWCEDSFYLGGGGRPQPGRCPSLFRQTGGF